jgi:Cys-rich protein (TIGR04453 family)
MKKGFYLLFILGIIFGSVFYMGFSPKRAACKLACETALTECKEKAEKNELKETACEAVYEECIEECKKK